MKLAANIYDAFECLYLVLYSIFDSFAPPHNIYYYLIIIIRYFRSPYAIIPSNER